MGARWGAYSNIRWSAGNPKRGLSLRSPFHVFRDAVIDQLLRTTSSETAADQPSFSVQTDRS